MAPKYRHLYLFHIQKFFHQFEISAHRSSAEILCVPRAPLCHDFSVAERKGPVFVSGHLFVAECVMPDTNVDALDVHRHNLPGPPWVPSWGRTKGTQRLGRVRTTRTQKGFPKQTSGIFLLLLWPIPCWCLRVLLPSRRAGAQSWTSCFDRPRFPGGFVQSHPRLQTPPSLLIPCNSYISRLYLSLHFQTHIFPPGCLTRASHLTGPKLSSWLIPLSHLLLPQSLPIQKITTTRLA